MPSFEAISRKLKHREQSEIAADTGRRVRAKLRGLTKKEPPREYSRGELAGLPFEERMAALGLQEVSPVHGRPAWKPDAKDIEDDFTAALEAELQADRMDKLVRDYKSELSFEAAFLPPYVEQRDRPDPHASPAPIPAPAPAAPQRPVLASLKITARTPVGQLARVTGYAPDGSEAVTLQVTERREGRLMAVSVEPADGPPFRLCVRRDRAGRLIGLSLEDR